MEHKHIRSNRPSEDEHDLYSELDYSNLNMENIFVTPIWSMEIECDNQEILDECYDLQNKFPNGVYKSNERGWQSNVYDIKDIRKHVTPKIQNLAINVRDITNDLVEDYAEMTKSSVDYNTEAIGWWININNGFSYNVYHTHPGCSMIAIYYAKIPQVVENEKRLEGQLVLLRQDAMCHNVVFSNIESMCEVYIRPKERHLYIMPSILGHYVTSHTSNDDRVSIAFNIG
jgi:uncharacterized protein (TIGR02466 family)